MYLFCVIRIVIKKALKKRSVSAGLCATYMVSMGDLGSAASPVSKETERIVFV
jgi:hypothetical protein